MPHLSSPESSPPKSPIDLKQNGPSSRIRNHKGNMPSLPQTKQCGLCPAKFTRTTHLNRHLRSHTNERAHRCAVCSAEFTRSDLLTRHKRTCGDSNNVNRSRRKSCQACAESKVKCNLQQPCSKCTSRGKECVFINDPQVSRDKKFGKKASPRSSATRSENDFSESATSLDSLGPSSPSSTFSFGSQGPDTLSYLLPPNQPSLGSSFASGVSNVSDCSSPACSSRSSPRLELYDPHKFAHNSIHLNLEALEINPDLHGYFPNPVEPFVDHYSSCLPRIQTEANLSGWFETHRMASTYGNVDPSSYPQTLYPTINHDFVTGPANLNTSCSGKSPFSRQHVSTAHLAGQVPTAPYYPPSLTVNPTTEEFNHYLYLFFTAFSTQIPLFHRPTWKMEGTHPLLLKAMYACGALFAKTPKSLEFINETLTLSRDTIIAEFSIPTASLKDQMSLLVAVVLLQSIGLIQPRPEQWALSRSYHEILVMMIRKTGLIKLIGSWPAPDISSPQLLDSAWKDWARYETFKRALVFAYLQDCYNCVYFSSMPTFTSDEFEINLPSDDDLWKAANARDWYQVLSVPGSNPRLGTSRVLGTSMQQALYALKDQGPASLSHTLNPFSAFVVVHAILRDIFSTPSHSQLGFPPGGINSSPLSPMIPASDPLAVQYALHNWQQIWAMSSRGQFQDHRTPFVHDAMTFYWLARLAQGAKQIGSLQIRPLSSKEELEERYRMVRAWLNQIKANNSSNSSVHNDPQYTPSMTFTHSLSMFSS
ncbi:hypothetical protein CPC08DRAFT_659666 [Agrocybe pediades]|nr:hypothetical protein CPC08DRAFT_659666 [Agrocybe pediades]